MNLSAKSIITRIVIGTILLSVGAIIGVYHGISRDPVWYSLFDGETLDGWELKAAPDDQEKGYWQVVEGAIVCNSMGDKNHGAVFLQHKLPIDDFELKLKFQAFRDSPGNSGVQIRSRWDADSTEAQGGRMEGPQIDIHPPLPWRTGLIYDETWESRRWISPSMESWKISEEQGPEEWLFNYANDANPWNDLVIRCEGTKIQVTVNRVPISDFDGTGILDSPDHQKRGVGMNGQIALQLHQKDELHLKFKDIFIREL
jgi:hypothetical protein